MLVALFGAIVASSGAMSGAVTPGALGDVLNHDAAQSFRWVFFGDALTLTAALIAILLLEEKPLQSDVAPESK
jgi:hypothetical protein